MNTELSPYAKMCTKLQGKSIYEGSKKVLKCVFYQRFKLDPVETAQRLTLGLLKGYSLKKNSNG